MSAPVRARKRRSSGWLAAVLGLAALAAAPNTAGADEVLRGDFVEVRWLAPEVFGPEPVTVGLHFAMDPHWHVYWHNPGDSGAAPRFERQGTNVGFGPIRWPWPSRIPVAHLSNLGYEDETVYMFEVTPGTGNDPVQIRVELEWLVCKEECLPGFGSLTLERPRGPETRWNAAELERLQHFEARVPRPAAGSGWQVAEARTAPGRLELRLDGPVAGRTPELFPVDGHWLRAGEPTVRQENGSLVYVLATERGQPAPARTDFVLVDGKQAWTLADVPVIGPDVPVAPGDAAWPLWLLWLAAFGGGLLLNLMPCVFPVLSIKLFGLIETGSQRLPFAGRMRESLLYAAGVLTTFAALGGVFLGLRAAGAAVGWGFQLQSPVVLVLLILLFWLMALSFLGTFEFGHGLMRMAGKVGGRGGSAFVTGILAVFVAAPCTAPLMGSALGAAATLPAPAAMLIFVGLGLGLALPFVLLAASPGLLARLPAPGPWMETVRGLLAFPLLLTVLWLLWVLGRLLGEPAWLLGGGLLIATGFAVWLAGLGRLRGRRIALVFGLAAAAATLVRVGQLEPVSATTRADAGWAAWSEAAVASARERGEPVFVDFTAAWCITCQVNKQAVLDRAAAADLFERHGVRTLRADWTRHDPAITAALAGFGRSSVPLYVFWPADGSPARVLPTILSQGTLEDLFTEP